MLAGMLDLTRLVFNLLLIQSYAAALLTLYNSYVSLEYKYKSYFAVSLVNAVSTTAISIFLITTWFSDDRYIGRVIGNAVPAIIIGMCINIILNYFGITRMAANCWWPAMVVQQQMRSISLVN